MNKTDDDSVGNAVELENTIRRENNEQRQILVQEAMKRCKELGIDY